MNKYVIIALLITGAVGFQTTVSMAADEVEPKAAQAVEVDNKVCPVSGEKIETDGKMQGMKVEYNGKVYNLCCAMCEGDFKKDPAKYSKIADDEVAHSKTK